MSTKAPALLTDERIAEILVDVADECGPSGVCERGIQAFLIARAIEAEVRTLAAAEQQEPVAWACFKPSGEIEPDLVSPSKEDCEFWSSHEPDANWSILPLYTATPQQPAAASAGANDWRETLEAIEAKATGGLCQFSLTGKHAFLGDIRELVRAALQSPPVATAQQSEAHE